MAQLPIYYESVGCIKNKKNNYTLTGNAKSKDMPIPWKEDLHESNL